MIDSKDELIIVKEYNGKYFVEKEGENIEVEKPEDNKANKLIIILKCYSNPRL